MTIALLATVAATLTFWPLSAILGVIVGRRAPQRRQAFHNALATAYFSALLLYCLFYFGLSAIFRGTFAGLPVLTPLVILFSFPPGVAAGIVASFTWKGPQPGRLPLDQDLEEAARTRFRSEGNWAGSEQIQAEQQVVPSSNVLAGVPASWALASGIPKPSGSQPVPSVDETPFFRLKLTRKEVKELRSHSRGAETRTNIDRLLKYSYVHGCLPFGRLDETAIRPDGPVSATLARTCTAAVATQQGFNFSVVCYVFPPMLDPWLHQHSAALLSRDGRFGLSIIYFGRERSEELDYSCTSALADGTFVITRRLPPNLFDPPSHRVAEAPTGGLKEMLAFHASRIAELPIVPFSGAEVPQAVLALNRNFIDFNVALGRFLPLSARELERIHWVMRGKSVTDLV